MKLPRKIIENIDAKSILVHAKVCDSGSYALKDVNGKEVAVRDDYVPSFFPDEHYGDYLILDIELESGIILNWKRPDELSALINKYSMEQQVGLNDFVIAEHLYETYRLMTITKAKDVALKQSVPALSGSQEMLKAPL